MSDQHHYLTGKPSPTHQGRPASLDLRAGPAPFPSALEMMASDINWTSDLGNAFLAQQQDVMDAVQRQRLEAGGISDTCAAAAGIIVGGAPYITICPFNPAFIVVPYYDPASSFLAPRPGLRGRRRDPFRIRRQHRRILCAVGLGLGFGRFDWGAHTVFIKQSNRSTTVPWLP